MTRLTKAAAAALILVSCAGCTLTERAAAVGAGTGAVIGGVTTGTVQGAAVGAAIGGVAGALIGKAATPGDCYYRGRNGRRYVARC
jgi:Glycine zipper